MEYRVALRLRDTSSADMLVRRLGRMGFEARSWGEMAGNILRLIEEEKFFSNVLMATILVISSLSIMNVMLMLTESRKKSIGVLKALGSTSLEIFMVYFLLALIYGLAGYLLGVAASLAVSRALGAISIEVLQGGLRIPFILDTPLLLGSLGYALLVATLSCGYSAYRASRLNPVEVMRFE